MHSTPVTGGRRLEKLLNGANTMLLVLSLFLTVVGSRLLLIDRYGSDLPHWDQWDAELVGVIQPYRNDTLNWENLIQPHNEHRILLTRLLVLGLFLENGQWDAKLEMVVNVFLQTLVAVAMFLLGKGQFGRAAIQMWWFVVAIAFSLPFGYDNTLWGFQSQFYLMSAFSLLLFWVGSRRPFHSASYQSGLLLVCATILLFTLGSGFFAALALLGVWCFELILHPQERQSWRSRVLPLIILLGSVVAGWLLHEPVAEHQGLKAGSTLEFFHALTKLFSWPWSGLSSLLRACLVALGLWMPWLSYVFLITKLKSKFSGQHLLILSIGLWVALQMAAMAASRGAGALPPPSRYTDTLIFGLLVNFLALWSLFHLLPNLKWRQCHALLSVAWVALAGWGLASVTKDNLLVDIPLRHRIHQEQHTNVTNFVLDNEDEHLLGKPPGEVPHPFPEQLIAWLRDPAVRAILPFSVREPLPVHAIDTEELDSPGFSAQGLPPGLPPSPGHWVRGSFISSQGGTASKGIYQAKFHSPGKFPYLGWMVAGHLDERGSFMTIKAEGKAREKLLASAPSQTRWQPVFVRSRAGSYEWQGKDNSVSRWLAFTPPKEIGRLSRQAMLILQQAELILALGLCLFVLGGFWSRLKKEQLR